MDFETAVHQIQRAYDDLGYELGWRFLYSPAATFSPTTRVDSHPKSNIIRNPAARERSRSPLERLTRITDFWTGRLIAGVIAAAFILSYGAASEVIS